MRKSTLLKLIQATTKTLKSVCSMLYTFKQLYKEGYINMEAASLPHIGIKLATDNEILHYEIEGL